MSKFEVSQNPSIFSKDNQPRSKVKEGREGMFQDVCSRDMKENDMKHMNAIKPYVNKERKNSKREIKAVSSQGEINKSRSKRIESTCSNRKSIQPHQSSSILGYQNMALINACYPLGSVVTTKQKGQGSENTQIYQQMMRLKGEYKQLKTSYNNLVRQKELGSRRQQKNKLAFEKQTVLLKEQMEKHKKCNSQLQGQIERIKRECFKIIQSEKFKYRKLEQTLQQKQLMIAYLRKQLQVMKKQRLMVLSNNGGNTSNTNSNNLSVVSNSAYNTYNNNSNNPGRNSQQLLQQINSSSIVSSQEDNLQRIFLIQNSMPIFSYQAYAKLNANPTGKLNANPTGNVLVEDSDNSSETRMGKESHKNNIRRSEYEQDSLSFSRDKSKQFDSVHSLLTINNHHNDDQTILTFTKKDIIVLNDDSFQSSKQLQTNNNPKNSQELSFQDTGNLDQHSYPTFQIKKHQRRQKQKQIISFESIKAKRIHSKSEKAQSKREGKNSKLHTKRLEIMTDPYPDEKQKEKTQDQHSCDTKKKYSKNKIKNTKKSSKSQALHNSMMSEALHGSFIKKDSTSLHQSKSHHHTKRK